MDYEQIIVDILLEAGDKGLSLKKITHHVYNSTNTLFDAVDYDALAAIVRQVIKANSRTSTSTFERTDVKGHYRVNRSSEKFLQQKLVFSKEEEL